jgi:hypothetical protein
MLPAQEPTDGVREICRGDEDIIPLRLELPHTLERQGLGGIYLGDALPLGRVDGPH